MSFTRNRTVLVMIARSTLLIPILFCGTISVVRGVTIGPADILVADPDFVHVSWSNGNPDFDTMNPALWKVDPITGERELVTSKTKGGGAPLRSVTHVVVDSLGRMTIADPYLGALLRVDPNTGDRSYFSGFSSAIALDNDNSLITLNHLTREVFRVDGDSGSQTLISGPSRGSGPLYDFEPTLAVGNDGSIWTAVYGNSESGILRIDPSTGDRQLISGLGTGSGPGFLFYDIINLQIADDQTLMAVNMGTLCQVELATGHRSFLTLQGSQINFMSGLARSPNGGFVVTDERNGNVLRVDPDNGIVTLLSENTPGHEMWMPQNIFVVNVPETGSTMLFAMGIAIGYFGLCRHIRIYVPDRCFSPV